MQLQLINWTEAMSVDGGQIDNTHRNLISLINRLHLIVNHAADCDSVSNILCELADYTGAGFLVEEKVMILSKYNERDQHVAHHWEFIDCLTNIIADFERGREVGNDLLIFLVHWVASHIRNNDQQFGLFLRGGTRRQLNGRLRREGAQIEASRGL